MLNDTEIQFITYGDDKSYRKWQISELRYDFDSDGYCSVDITDKYPTKYGTPYRAYEIAKYELRHYKKVYGSDCIIIIKEVDFIRKEV